MTRALAGLMMAALFAAAPSLPAPAQTAAPGAPPPAEAKPSPPVYRPPSRGAPGGRVGGASRSATRWTVAPPVIELLAPADHAGVTASATPTLYFFVSGSVSWPTQFTISAPSQPAPVVEATIPAPSAAGIYRLRLADYHARLQPGIAYTWSVSIVIDPHAWSRNIVASATIVYDPGAETAAASAAPLLRRADLLAAHGVWYDAVAAAAPREGGDSHAALDALIREVGLDRAWHYEQALRQRRPSG